MSPKIVLLATLLYGHLSGYCSASPVASSSNSALSVQGDDGEFDQAFGQAVLDKIRAGKAVKVGLETNRKLSFEQEVSCSSCGGNATPLAAGACTKESDCPNNQPCINSVCGCPADYLVLGNGTCIPNFFITLSGSTATSFGWPNCNPAVYSSVPGLVIGGVKPFTCIAIVTDSHTPPNDIPAYEDSTDAYIGVNAQSGQVYFNGGIPPAPSSNPVQPCGPSAYNQNGLNPDFPEAMPLVQTYEVQCIDSRGITSANNVVFDIVFPSCDVQNTC